MNAPDSQSCGCIPNRGIYCGMHQARWVNPPTAHFTTMVCAVCAQNNPTGYGLGSLQYGVTQVGLLWVCGSHVERALAMQRTAATAPVVAGLGVGVDLEENQQ